MGRKTVLSLVAVLVLGGTLRAQEPSQADSLRREIQRLTARIDSLERLVRRLAGEQRDTTAAGDELAALRAAAAAAGGGAVADTSTRRSEREQAQFVDRSRNLNQLNPEISVTGDVRLNATSGQLAGDNVDVREFEFSFQSALDPYSNTKIFAAVGEEGIEIEEAYAYWTGLPGNLRLDIGRFRQQLGELNRWHAHALPQSEFPLVLGRFFGEEGLVGDGVGLYWIAPFGGGAWGAHELWGQATLANNEALFQGGNRVALLGHLNNFWQLSRSTFVQVGGTAIYGENPDSALKTRVFGLDARITWRPPDRALYRNFTVRGEGYRVTHEVAGTPTTRTGAYASAEYQLTRRLFAGARYDYVESSGVDGEHEWAIVPNLTWWQSEWVYLRAEWQRASVPVAVGLVERSNRFVLQAVWAIGPHKHELF
ncbi:MAG: hypothetical protein HYT81_09505 [Gemmatimonadetes bacterium]|nr:hypothetical protein [Gemmatimonadota bacterium]